MAGPVMNNSKDLKFDVNKFGDPKNPCVISIVGTGASMNSMMPIVNGLVAEGLYVINYNPRDACGTEAFKQCAALVPEGKDVMAEMMGLFDANYQIDVSKDFYAPYNWYDMADDVAAIMEQQGIQRASIIGFSTGGTIAQVVMTRLGPDKLNAAVICSSAFDKVPAGSPHKCEMITTAMGAMATLTLESSKEDRVGKKLPCDKALFEVGDDDEDEAVLKKAIEDDTDNGWVDVFGGMNPYSTLAWAHFTKSYDEHVEALKANKVQCMVVYGEKDPVVDPEQSKKLLAVCGSSVAAPHQYGHILGPKTTRKQQLANIAEFIRSRSMRK